MDKAWWRNESKLAEEDPAEAPVPLRPSSAPNTQGPYNPRGRPNSRPNTNNRRFPGKLNPNNRLPHKRNFRRYPFKRRPFKKFARRRPAPLPKGAKRRRIPPPCQLSDKELRRESLEKQKCKHKKVLLDKLYAQQRRLDHLTRTVTREAFQFTEEAPLDPRLMAANAALKKVNHRIKDFEQIVHQNKLPDTKGALLPKMSPTKEKAAQKKQLDQFCKPRILYPRNPRNRLFSHLQMKKQKVDENPPIYQKYVAPTGPAPKATPADPWEPELGVPWKPLQSAPTKPQPTGWLDLKTQDYVPQKEFVSRSVWGRSPSPPPTSRNMDIGSSSDCVDMVDEVDSQPQTWQTSNWWRRHSSSVLV